MVADNDDQRSTGLVNVIGKRRPDVSERRVSHDAVKGGYGVRRGDITSQFLCDRMDNVTVQYQRDAAVGLLIRYPTNESCQTLCLTKDLKFESVPAHVEVRYDVKLIVLWKLCFSSHTSTPAK